MLAAAVGDALGWPQEDRSGRVGGSRGVKPQLDFVEWRRRSGGRYASHEVVVGAGEYSDDTQLIAAVGRSLLSGDDWWKRWTRLELPFWLFYERGGGGATKRAAQAWTKGSPPWEGASRDRYFAAGGNGVAMRILPHCLRGGDNFATVAQSILADGIATHGHPRALVGALVHAYALWGALRRRDRLPYGTLIDETRDQVAIWSDARATIDDIAPDWQKAAVQAEHGSYDDLWMRTVSEMIDLLTVCADAIRRGALSVDRETLQRLGAFDKRVSSSGTVTAASTLFLASRHASRAEQGLLAAAFSHGADTDTLASMTGSLLAAINGRDWLGSASERVQDGAYLLRLARELIDPATGDDRVLTHPDWNMFVQRLEQSQVGNDLRLPDNRSGLVRSIVNHPTKSRNTIKTFVVETYDGQTLFLRRIKRAPQKSSATTHVQGRRQRSRIGVALEIKDLERSIAFWRDIAGLDVTVTEQHASVHGHIALIPTARTDTTQAEQLSFALDKRLHRPQSWIVVIVDEGELQEIRKRLDRAGLGSDAATMRSVRCADPDGHLVEFRRRDGISDSSVGGNSEAG